MNHPKVQTLSLVLLSLLFSSCSKQAPTNAHDGIYHAYETTEIGTTVEASGKALPLLNYQLSLVDGRANMTDRTNDSIVFQGPFEVNPSPRSSAMKGSEQISVTVADEVFKPSIYTYEGKVYYLKLEGERKSLTIFSKFSP